MVSVPLPHLALDDYDNRSADISVSLQILLGITLALPGFADSLPKPLQRGFEGA